MTKTARIESATRIYFASDIHLGSGDAETARANERRFVAWLDRAAADAEAIFLLGDIFDFWFEYRRVVPKGFVRTLSKLAELTDRVSASVSFRATTICGCATISDANAAWKSTRCPVYWN